jgi:hypothetical protein
LERASACWADTRGREAQARRQRESSCKMREATGPLPAIRMIRQRVQLAEFVIALALCGALARAQTSCAGCGSAAPREVRAHLELVAPDGCGTLAELRERVRRRSERMRFVEPGPGVRRARAELRVLPDRTLRATLVWWSEDGRELVRELRAPGCADALDALALVLAVALSPDAEAGVTTTPGSEGGGQEAKGAPSRAEEGSPASGSELAASASSAASASATASSATEVSSSTPSADERTGSDGSSSGASWSLRPFAGISAGARFGPAPGALPGFGGFIGLTTPGIPDVGLVRFNLSRHRRAGFAAEGGSAEFELDSLRLDLCPLGAARAPIVVHGCVSGEFGVLAAGGSSTLSARSVERPWRSLGAALLLAFRPATFIELELKGAVEHPLIRDRFQFFPRIFHEVPPITAGVELGLAARIP